MEEKINSAYREFRAGAYRNKYGKALLFGGKSFTFGNLLVRAEYAYNTFRQMGIEAGERVCLWLPDCPDLLASFYGLSRLGAVPVLAYYGASPREIRNIMNYTAAEILITTAGRYDLYSRLQQELPQSKLILCRPELDMKSMERGEYLRWEWEENPKAERPLLDRLMAQNQYHSMEAPAGDQEREELMIFGSSSFLSLHPVAYRPQELAQASAQFWAGKAQVEKVYIENSFATEGGFLAAHSALCAGKTVLWGIGPIDRLIRKHRPDFLVATEEFFWELRQNPLRFGKKYKKLAGGYQIGKPMLGVMQKFASRVMLGLGAGGGLEDCPVALKTKAESLYFVRDFGVRFSDMEKELSQIAGIHCCRIEEDGGICLKIVPDGAQAAGALGKSIAACCRWEMNDLHLPQKVEFHTTL